MENTLGGQPQQSVFTLDGKVKELDPNASYLIDFSKLTSVNDLVLILSAMGITFHGQHPHIELIKPFLNLDHPINLNGNMQRVQEPNAPQAKEMTLPKLKVLKKD